MRDEEELSYPEIGARINMDKSQVCRLYRVDLDAKPPVVLDSLYERYWTEEAKHRCRQMADRGASRIELMRLGIGVPGHYFREWFGAKGKEDFTNVMRDCQERSEMWWHQQGRRGLWYKPGEYKLHYPVYQFGMQVRAIERRDVAPASAPGEVEEPGGAVIPAVDTEAILSELGDEADIVDAELVPNADEFEEGEEEEVQPRRRRLPAPP